MPLGFELGAVQILTGIGQAYRHPGYSGLDCQANMDMHVLFSIEITGLNKKLGEALYKQSFMGMSCSYSYSDCVIHSLGS